MTSIEIARKMSELGMERDACTAYTLALHEGGGQDPAVDMEAALYLLQHGGDYKVAYTTFVELHQRGCFQEDCFSIMTHAFYEPNVKLLETRYESNRNIHICSERTFLTSNFCPCGFIPMTTTGLCPMMSRRDALGST